MSNELYSKILGCMIGNAIGDAFGGVVEFCDAERVKKITGKLWVDEFLPYSKDQGVHPARYLAPSQPMHTG